MKYLKHPYATHGLAFLGGMLAMAMLASTVL